MRSYEIKITDTLSDWSKIPILNIDCECWGTYPEIEAYGQISYNSDALLVHLWTREPETRAEEFGETCMPCRDSCLEIFLSPMENDNRYLNLEFNSNGCYYFGIADCFENAMRILPNKKENLFSQEVIRKDDGWEIFFSIPFDLIRRFFPDFKVSAGKSIRANCYKCADKGKYKHYLSWNKIESEKVSFHNTDFFGKMTFVK